MSVMRSARIELKYKSPSRDFERCAGYNPDGSVNISSTLERIRQTLAASLRSVEKLIEVKNDLVEIQPMGPDVINVLGKDETIERLIQEGALTLLQPPVEPERLQEPRETHAERLRRLQNIMAVYDPQRRMVEPIENLQQQARHVDDESDDETEDETESDEEDWEHDPVVQQAMLEFIQNR